MMTDSFSYLTVLDNNLCKERIETYILCNFKSKKKIILISSYV